MQCLSRHERESNGNVFVQTIVSKIFLTLHGSLHSTAIVFILHLYFKRSFSLRSLAKLSSLFVMT